MVNCVQRVLRNLTTFIFYGHTGVMQTLHSKSITR